MPRNAQGLYTLPAGNPVTPGTIIESVWANTTMSDLADAITGSLPRDGSAPMTGPLTLNGQPPSNARHAVDRAYVDQFMAYSSGMPIGSVSAFGGTVAPAGWLKCDGQAVSRAVYSDLFTLIGTTYGSGDNSTTFNVPDLRDEFIRGRADARAVGSKQAAAFATHIHALSDPGHAHTQAMHSHVITTDAHTHGVNDPGHSHSLNVSNIQGEGWAFGIGAIQAAGQTGSSGTGISLQAAAPSGNSDQQTPAIASAVSGITMGTAGGDETRPQNVALDYYIKAVHDAAGVAVMTGIDTSDAQMISVDNTNPVVPELVIHSNVAFGTVKLDASGQIPLNLLPTGSQQLLGFWDASGGQTPSQASPSTDYASGDTYIISVTGTLTVYDPVTLTASPTVVAVGSLLQYVENSITNPTGWYYVVSSTTVVASQVGLTPVGNISATNVQAGFAEVDGDLTTQAAAIAANTSALATKVTKTSNTGSALLPAGTDAQRDASPAIGAMRFSSTSSVWEGWDGSNWVPVGGGITQAQADARYLQLTGGTVSGNLMTVASYVSSTQATAANALTRKDYVDGAVGAKVSKSGDTMTGALTIDGASDIGLVVKGSTEGGELQLIHKPSGRHVSVDYVDTSRELRLINWSSGSPAVSSLKADGRFTVAAATAAADAVNLGQFPNSVPGGSNPGNYINLPGGIEIRFGSGNGGGVPNVTIDFADFANGCIAFVVSGDVNNPVVENFGSRTKFSTQIISAGGGNVWGYSWIAIGA